jgi:hypothetical protein
MFPTYLALVALLLVPCLSQGALGPASPDVTARFLAGLPVSGTPLESLSQENAWVTHAKQFEESWQQLETRQLVKIRAWEAQNLPEAAASKRPLFYFFSGPDILYAETLFPKASTYLLAGLEPVGTVPDLRKLPREALPASLATLRHSLNSVLSFSFFKTKDMKVDLAKNQLNGTLPILYVFLARTGCRIDSAELVWLNSAGELTSSPSATPGAKVTFSRSRGERQTLYYFQTDLSNDGIETQPGFLRFCGQQGSGNSLLKAASYLLHGEGFRVARSFLLQHSALLLQDDSGIPLRSFETGRWTVRCFGNYAGPIDLFKESYQSNLATLYQRQQPSPLPFAFGYRWHSNQSSLIVVSPAGGLAATPIPATSNGPRKPSEAPPAPEAPKPKKRFLFGPKQ